MILTEQGFSAIRTNNIARLLGKDKNLIRYHFGSLNGLLKTYIQDKDYWKPFFERFRFSDQPDAKEIAALRKQLGARDEAVQLKKKLATMTPELVAALMPLLELIESQHQVGLPLARLKAIQNKGGDDHDDGEATRTSV